MQKGIKHISKYSKWGAIFGLFFAVVFTGKLQAQVKAQVDSTRIKIGQEITYSMQIEVDTTDFVSFPEGQTFLPLEVIESYPIDTTFTQGKNTLLKRYGLTQFDSGSYMIPQQRVLVNDKAFLTDSLLVEVNNIAVDTTVQKMFDIRPGIEVPKPPGRYGWLLAVLIGGLIGGAVAYWYSKRKKAIEEANKQLPPYEEAITALQELDDAKLLTQDKTKAYYSTLTEIVKRYLDREVDSTALESTSQELIDRLQLHKDAGHFDFSRETLHKLDSILRRADLVKFAKMQQEMGQARADRKDIEGIINTTKEIIPEPTEEELLATKEYQEMMARQQQRKRLTMIGVIIVGALILSSFVYGLTYGFDELSDQVFGNEMRDLAESDWVRSEYGMPAVIIETPDVLVRTPVQLADSLSFAIKNMDVFSFGENTKAPLQVVVSTTQFTRPVEADLDAGLNGVLSSIEERGASNLIVKRDDFETDQGIKGLRAYGQFKPAPENRRSADLVNYEILYFAQEQGVQQIMIVYEEDERFASQILRRIKESVELEIPKN
ncbi:MAG: DUF4381 domain-containing protein [Gilvibacter sp.]